MVVQQTPSDDAVNTHAEQVAESGELDEARVAKMSAARRKEMQQLLQEGKKPHFLKDGTFAYLTDEDYFAYLASIKEQ